MTQPAAFRRLCVETHINLVVNTGRHPAAFRRLCVETTISFTPNYLERYQPPSGGCVLKLSCNQCLNQAFVQPPSGGCVLKHYQKPEKLRLRLSSRLQAAVC